jgi:ComEC/Rec2-related protein
MLGAFVVFTFSDSLTIKITYTVLFSIPFIISFLRKFKGSGKKMLLRVVSVASLGAMLFSYIYFDLWFKAYDRYDGEATISGTVADMTTDSYLTKIILKTDDINNTPLSKYKLIVYVNSDEYHNFSIGSKIKLKGEIEKFQDVAGGFEEEIYHIARGISGVVNEVCEFEHIETGDYPISYKISELRHSLCRRIISLSDKESGGLICAFLLGERDYLPEGARLNFSRIGISHILALSGMNIAILTLALTKILSFLRMNKKIATGCSMLFTVLFMAFTGFSVSVVRAGVMLLISSALFLLSHSRDSMTSLFVALLIILTVQPYAVFDISLWLSALATLGIVVFSEYQSSKDKGSSFIGWIRTSLLASFFAISSTVLISVIKFDGISIISPVSTLIFTVLSQLLIYTGIILIILGGVLPIKLVTAPIGDLILTSADFLSEIDIVYASTAFVSITVLSVIFTVIFFGFFILKIEHKRIYLAFTGAFLSLILLLSVGFTHIENNEDKILYYSTGEALVIKDGGEVSAINLATDRKQSVYLLYGKLADDGVTAIDKYVVSLYSYYLPDSINSLAESIKIREICFPTPQDEAEYEILEKSKALCDVFGIKTSLYSKTNDIIELNNTSIHPFLFDNMNGENKRLITITKEDKLYTYLNTSMLDGKTKSMTLEIIDQSHTIIFGHHASGSDEYKFTYKLKNAEKLVISDTKMKIHKDTLEAYEDCEIYYTPMRVRLYIE